MQLIVLYGPPAVGKLTIARLLAKRTGLRLFHNHLVLDTITEVFDFRTPGYLRLRELFWLEVFTEAAKADISLIFTFMPETSLAPGFPERIVQAVQPAGGHVRFVELTCPEAELDARLDAPSRAEFAKLRSLADMRDLRAQGWLDYAMPEPEVRIDTSELQPEDAAEHIALTLGLARA